MDQPHTASGLLCLPCSDSRKLLRTSMMHSFLVALLLAVLVAPASAQSPYACVPYVMVFGPEPVTLPLPLAPTDSPARPALRWGAEGPHPAPGWLDGMPATSVATGSGRQASSDCPTLIREQTWAGTGWSPDHDQTVTTYDDTEHPLTITERILNGTELVDYVREYYTYDALGALVEFLVERHQHGTGQVQPVNRIQFTTDASGRLLSAVYEQRDDIDWKPIYRRTYSYGAGPSATGYLREEAVAGGGWEPSYRGTFTYTAAGLRKALVYETWAGTQWTFGWSETWVYDAGHAVSVTTEFIGSTLTADRDRTLFDYAGPLLASTLYQRDTGSGWRDITRKAYTYDADDQLSSYTYAVSQGDGIPLNLERTLYLYNEAGLSETQSQGWDGSSWSTSWRELYARLPDGHVAERVNQHLNGAAWVNRSRLLFSYDGTTASEAPAAVLGLGLRPPQPNPAQTTARAVVTLDAAGPARLVVLDLLGREVATVFDGTAAAGETAVSVDVAALPAGVYVLRLSAGAQSATQRLAVVR